MPGIYRQGATGALLDEYERAISELKKLITPLPDALLINITDPLTGDENCRTIQTILSHVVSAGYGYATSIHKLKGYVITRPDKTFHVTIREYLQDLDDLFCIYGKSICRSERQ